MRSQFLQAESCALASGSEEPGNGETPSSFTQLIDYAIEQRVDFLALAGNLFSSWEPPARAFEDVYLGLSRLKALNIPVFAVEGRRDQRPAGAGHGFRDVLRGLDLLRDLDVMVEERKLSLLRVDPTTKRGSYADVGRVRIYGVRFYGRALEPVLREVAAALPFVDAREVDYSVALLHVDPRWDLATSEVSRVAAGVDYLALGGFGKPAQDLEKVFALDLHPVSGSSPGFFHVSIDTFGSIKHSMRFVPYRESASPPAEPTAGAHTMPGFQQTLGDGLAADLQRLALQRDTPEQLVALIRDSLHES